MKTNYIKLLLLTIVLPSLLFTLSCEKSEFNLSKEEQAVEKTTTYLKFIDRNAFLEALNNSTSKTLQKPEGFESMLDVYIRIENAKSLELRNKLINRHSSMLMVDSEGDLDIIVVDYNLAALLSPEGLIKIGNEISQFEFDRIKTITDGDESKISILNDTKVTEGSVNISVEPFKQERISPDKAAWSGSSKKKNANLILL